MGELITREEAIKAWADGRKVQTRFLGLGNVFSPWEDVAPVAEQRCAFWYAGIGTRVEFRLAPTRVQITTRRYLAQSSDTAYHPSGVVIRSTCLSTAHPTTAAKERFTEKHREFIRWLDHWQVIEVDTQK